MTRNEVLRRATVFSFDYGEPECGECEVLGEDSASGKIALRLDGKIFISDPERCFADGSVARKKCRDCILGMIQSYEEDVQRYRDKLAIFDAPAADPDDVASVFPAAADLSEDNVQTLAGVV